MNLKPVVVATPEKVNEYHQAQHNFSASLKSKLKQAKIWQELVTLVTINNSKFSEILFSGDFDVNVFEAMSDEFILFHQSKLENSFISVLCTNSLSDSITHNNIEKYSVTAINNGALFLPAGHEPAYLVFKNNQSLNKIIIQSNGFPMVNRDELVNFLKEGCESTDVYSHDLRKVLSIQKKFRDITSHGTRMVHHNNDVLSSDIVAFMNFFTESSCGVLARMFALCCTAAGLETRVWRLNTHTTTEIKIDGKWVIIDGDPGAVSFYPHPDNPQQLSGLADLWEQGGSFLKNIDFNFKRKTGSDKNDDYSKIIKESKQVKRIAALLDKERVKQVETEDSLHARLESVKPIDLALRLLPGETITWAYKDSSPWNASTSRSFMTNMNSRLLIRELQLVCEDILEHLDISGIVYSNKNEYRKLEVTDNSCCSVNLDSTYPVLDVIIEIVFEKTTKPADIVCSLYANEKQCALIEPLFNHVNNKIHYRLRRALLRRKYNEKLQLKFEFINKCNITSWRILRLCQTCSFGLPQIRQGDNLVTIKNANGNHICDLGSNLKLYFGKEVDLIQGSTIFPVSPENNGIIKLHTLQDIKWSFNDHDLENKGQSFDFEMAHDKNMLFVIASNFNRFTSGTHLELTSNDRAFLERGRQYFWRVRNINKDKKGEWSNIFTFRVE